MAVDLPFAIFGSDLIGWHTQPGESRSIPICINRNNFSAIRLARRIFGDLRKRMALLSPNTQPETKFLRSCLYY